MKRAVAAYDGVTRDVLRAHFKKFLEEVIPTAEELGMKMCVHPDDPPHDIIGLPRLVSDADDIAWVLGALEAPANGLALCLGSLGANPANDLPAMAARFGDRVHFAHLRNVRWEADGSFEEAAHLDGATDMVALLATFLEAEAARGVSISFRPDHGHELLSDIGAGAVPGYPLVGRLRCLAELRGVIAGLQGRAAL